MFKSISFVFALSLIASSTAFGQTGSTTAKKKNSDVGFYGKRFVMQFGSGFHHNSVLKLASYPERQLRNNSFYLSYKSRIPNDQFNYSVYGNLGVVLKARTTLSLDFNYYFGNIFLKNVGGVGYYDSYGYYYYTNGYDARVKYNTFRIMPRIELAANGANAPVGLVNILGIGVEMSKLKSGNYTAITAYDSGLGSTISDRDIQMVDEKVFNLTFLYGLEYRLPISKNIAWNFGGYAHLNIPVQFLIDEGPFGTSSYSSSQQTYDQQHKNQLGKYRFQNLFSVRTGIVIML